MNFGIILSKYNIRIDSYPVVIGEYTFLERTIRAKKKGWIYNPEAII